MDINGPCSIAILVYALVCWRVKGWWTCFCSPVEFSVLCGMDSWKTGSPSVLTCVFETCYTSYMCKLHANHIHVHILYIYRYIHDICTIYIICMYMCVCMYIYILLYTNARIDDHPGPSLHLHIWGEKITCIQVFTKTVQSGEVLEVPGCGPAPWPWRDRKRMPWRFSVWFSSLPGEGL